AAKPTTAAGANGATGAATAAPAAAAASSADQIEMRFAWWGSQDRHDRTIKAIQLFQQKHPNITFSWEFAGFQDYFTKMTTEASGGGLPDLMQQDYAFVSQWVSNNLLMPLDDFISDNTINLSTVAKNTIDGGRINGKMYA